MTINKNQKFWFKIVGLLLFIRAFYSIFNSRNSKSETNGPWTIWKKLLVVIEGTSRSQKYLGLVALALQIVLQMVYKSYLLWPFSEDIIFSSSSVLLRNNFQQHIFISSESFEA